VYSKGRSQVSYQGMASAAPSDVSRKNVPPGRFFSGIRWALFQKIVPRGTVSVKSMRVHHLRCEVEGNRGKKGGFRQLGKPYFRQIPILGMVGCRYLGRVNAVVPASLVPTLKKLRVGQPPDSWLFCGGDSTDREAEPRGVWPITVSSTLERPSQLYAGLLAVL
jgi:hypothetical protein